MTLDSRIHDALELESFLGLGPGSHRDPNNIGGAMPRWPTVEQRPIKYTGEVLGTYEYDRKTGEFAYIPKITDERGNVRDGIRQIIFPATSDADA